MEVETGFEPVYAALQAATSPLGHSTASTPNRGTSSGRRDSNPRPSPWQGDALPTEPRPHAASSYAGAGVKIHRWPLVLDCWVWLKQEKYG